MLATECARVLGYRDSYLLFNKNRSLYKIIATQPEKDDLIHQEILPYSYRSRQIAIVTARSMFRQFGSRLIKDGRRVRDDYWESKARKQGFTEDDLAGEKRPGATKQREAAAAEAQNAHALTSLPHGEIIYSNGPAHLDGIGGINPATLAPLPMINLAPIDDLRPRDYSNVVRPRHEMSGTPYQDASRPTPGTDLLNHAAQTAEYNKVLGEQRANRGKYLEEYWKRPHEAPPSPAQRLSTLEGDNQPTMPQTGQSPHLASNTAAIQPGQQNMMHHPQQASSQMMAPQTYSQQQQIQNQIAQSPIRQMHTPMRPDQMHHRSPSMNMGPQGGQVQPGSYGYPPQANQMWQTPHQPQPSPLSQTHLPQQYANPPHLQHSQSSGSMHGQPNLQYATMGGMAGAQGYANMTRNPYQPSPSPQYMPQSSGGPQPGMLGWAPGQGGYGQQQGWQ